MNQKTIPNEKESIQLSISNNKKAKIYSIITEPSKMLNAHLNE